MGIPPVQCKYRWDGLAVNGFHAVLSTGQEIFPAPVNGQEPDSEGVTSSLWLDKSARSADTTSISQHPHRRRMNQENTLTRISRIYTN